MELPKQHLGHHLGPKVEAPPYEDADILQVYARLAQRWEASHDKED